MDNFKVGDVVYVKDVPSSCEYIGEIVAILGSMLCPYSVRLIKFISGNESDLDTSSTRRIIIQTGGRKLVIYAAGKKEIRHLGKLERVLYG